MANGKVANVQWSPPGLDYPKSLDHDHSKVGVDRFFYFMNLNFVFKFFISTLNKNLEL